LARPGAAQPRDRPPVSGASPDAILQLGQPGLGKPSILVEKNI
jgi:hypothetical protein